MLFSVLNVKAPESKISHNPVTRGCGCCIALLTARPYTTWQVTRLAYLLK